uniref:Transposase n=1 Tax=Coralloluteibacterium stylophorae TaxID=1776034 RepID=A0A8J7VQW5_9GAMM
MARLPRFDLPWIPQHIVQRGNNRQVCFAAEIDYWQYLLELRKASVKHRCAIHAYVLMTNHVHLLVTPEEAGGVSRMMQAIGRRYVGCFNARYRRTGTLWEGRFKSALVDSEHYLLRCYRYIELNPVRAHMTASPGDYRWSSYRYNANGHADPILTPHPEYQALGRRDVERTAAYAAFVCEGIDPTELDSLRLTTQQQRAWGSERFKSQIEALTLRAVRVRPRGRPTQQHQ